MEYRDYLESVRSASDNLLSTIDAGITRPFVMAYLAAIGVYLLIRGLRFPPREHRDARIVELPAAEVGDGPVDRRDHDERDAACEHRMIEAAEAGLSGKAVVHLPTKLGGAALGVQPA